MQEAGAEPTSGENMIVGSIVLKTTLSGYTVALLAEHNARHRVAAQ